MAKKTEWQIFIDNLRGTLWRAKLDKKTVVLNFSPQELHYAHKDWIVCELGKD